MSFFFFFFFLFLFLYQTDIHTGKRKKNLQNHHFPPPPPPPSPTPQIFFPSDNVVFRLFHNLKFPECPLPPSPPPTHPLAPATRPLAKYCTWICVRPTPNCSATFLELLPDSSCLITATRSSRVRNFLFLVELMFRCLLLKRKLWNDFFLSPIILQWPMLFTLS